MSAEFEREQRTGHGGGRRHQGAGLDPLRQQERLRALEARQELIRKSLEDARQALRAKRDASVRVQQMRQPAELRARQRHPRREPAGVGQSLSLLQLVLWSLLVIIVLKYLTFIMRADNRGEGGILALLALLSARNAKPGTFPIIQNQLHTEIHTR